MITRVHKGGRPDHRRHTPSATPQKRRKWGRKATLACAKPVRASSSRGAGRQQGDAETGTAGKWPNEKRSPERRPLEVAEREEVAEEHRP